MEAGWENRALEEQLQKRREYMVALLGDSITAQLGCALRCAALRPPSCRPGAAASAADCLCCSDVEETAGCCNTWRCVHYTKCARSRLHTQPQHPHPHPPPSVGHSLIAKAQAALGGPVGVFGVPGEALCNTECWLLKLA